MKAEMSFKDKLTDYRNRYGRLKGKGSKGRFLTRLSEAFGFERKYLVKLLNGQREFKPPRGRGRTYGKEVLKTSLSAPAPHSRLAGSMIIATRITLTGGASPRAWGKQPDKMRRVFGIMVVI